ncbi:MAG: hypothetical protein MJ082_00840 [Clostridia bacterium]|nr:hypothetical protein [Clostridia bacterium]
MAKLVFGEWLQRSTNSRFTASKKDLTEKIIEFLTLNSESKYMEGMVSSEYADQARKVYEDAKNKEVDLVGDPKYLIGRIFAERESGVDLDDANILSVMDMVTHRQNQYEDLSPVGRFFSYFNPFPNKYRDMRNEIKRAKDFLVDEKGMDRKEVERFVKEQTGAIRVPEKGPNQIAKEEAHAWLDGMNAAIEKGTTARGTMAKDRIAMDAFLRTVDKLDMPDYEAQEVEDVDMTKAIQDFQNETEMVPEYDGPKLTNKDLFAMMAAELGEDTVKNDFDLPDNFLDKNVPEKGGKEDPSVD